MMRALKGQKVLLTGGAGYIGRHLCVALARRGADPIILDNFSTSSKENLEGLFKVVGRPLETIHGDVRDTEEVRRTILNQNITSIVHLAAKKEINESINNPLLYYDNNVGGLISVLRAAEELPIKHIVFSSTAAVYGVPDQNPISESARLKPTSPYGRSKCIAESILADFVNASRCASVTILRYFNPIGSLGSGLIGESPRSEPSNLMPHIIRAAQSGKPLTINGADYDTVDGTAIRDFIHIMDLVEGHVAALCRLSAGTKIYNLGTGNGISVLELMKAFQAVTGKSVPYIVGPRRDGDVPVAFASAELAGCELGWSAKLDAYAMCRDSWAFAEASRSASSDA